MRKAVLIATLLMVSTATAGSAELAEHRTGMSEKNAKLLAKRLEGRVASEPVRCVTNSRVGQPVIYGEQTIIYSGIGRTEYLNKLPNRCPGLDDDDFIVTKRSGAQLCKGDPIEPVDRFSKISGPICRLGAFIPYVKPKN